MRLTISIKLKQGSLLENSRREKLFDTNISLSKALIAASLSIFSRKCIMPFLISLNKFTLNTVVAK
tara:strand:- start:204 stop:401 length:198 start_codon:yes stop_codon:yes gene_type:complete